MGWTFFIYEAVGLKRFPMPALRSDAKSLAFMLCHLFDVFFLRLVAIAQTHSMRFLGCRFETLDIRSRDYSEEMKSMKIMCQPTVGLLLAFLCSLLVPGIQAQNACASDCVRGIYQNNCGQSSCITGVSSSEQVIIIGITHSGGHTSFCSFSSTPCVDQHAFRQSLAAVC